MAKATFVVDLLATHISRSNNYEKYVCGVDVARKLQKNEIAKYYVTENETFFMSHENFQEYNTLIQLHRLGHLNFLPFLYTNDENHSSIYGIEENLNLSSPNFQVGIFKESAYFNYFETVTQEIISHATQINEFYGSRMDFAMYLSTNLARTDKSLRLSLNIGDYNDREAGYEKPRNFFVDQLNRIARLSN